MNNFFVKILDRALAAIGAFLFCQFPAFMQQYMQMLSGHLQESKSYVQMIEYNAGHAHKSLPEYIQKFLSQQDPDFVQQGKLMQEITNRYSDLVHAYVSLDEASVWTKPFVFIAKMHMDIAEEAYVHFSPAVTFTVETAVYALAGLLTSMVLFRIVAKSISMLFGFSKKVPTKN